MNIEYYELKDKYDKLAQYAEYLKANRDTLYNTVGELKKINDELNEKHVNSAWCEISCNIEMNYLKEEIESLKKIIKSLEKKLKVRNYEHTLLEIFMQGDFTLLDLDDMFKEIQIEVYGERLYDNLKYSNEYLVRYLEILELIKKEEKK